MDANTPLMIRIGAWFKRRETTLWTQAEAEALHEVNPTADDLDTLEPFYTAQHPTDHDPRRRSLETLLNSWTGELDKARNWAGHQQATAGGVVI